MVFQESAPAPVSNANGRPVEGVVLMPEGELQIVRKDVSRAGVGSIRPEGAHDEVHHSSLVRQVQVRWETCHAVRYSESAVHVSAEVARR